MIYPAEQLFADANFMTVEQAEHAEHAEHADYNGIKCLVLVIVTKFGNPELLKLGFCMNLLKTEEVYNFYIPFLRERRIHNIYSICHDW